MAATLIQPTIRKAPSLVSIVAPPTPREDLMHCVVSGYRNRTPLPHRQWGYHSAKPGWGRGGHRCTRIRQILAKAHGQSRQVCSAGICEGMDAPSPPTPPPRGGRGAIGTSQHFHSHPGLPCLNPAIVTPAQGSRESSTRPMISWRAVAGASSYRLQLVSREPEGRTLATIDTLVNDTRFVPPQALAMAWRGSACASRASARRGRHRRHRLPASTAS
jgi:hypothetical protein